MDIAGRIKQARIAAGLSQAGLAAALGVTYQQVCRIEQGVNRASSGQLYCIAEACGCDVADFYPAVQATVLPEGMDELMAHARTLDPVKLAIVLRLSRELRKLAA